MDAPHCAWHEIHIGGGGADFLTQRTPLAGCGPAFQVA